MDALDVFMAEMEAKRAAYGPIRKWLVHRSIAGKNGLWATKHPVRMTKELIHLYKNQVKWFIQRGRRGYSDFDTWSLDYYLARWMPDALQAIRESYSYPGNLTPEEWDAKLVKMQDGFRAVLEWKDMDYDGDWKTRSDEIEKRVREGLYEFADWFEHLWD